jgi:hypothetical protein
MPVTPPAPPEIEAPAKPAKPERRESHRLLAHGCEKPRSSSFRRHRQAETPSRCSAAIRFAWSAGPRCPRPRTDYLAAGNALREPPKKAADELADTTDIGAA